MLEQLKKIARLREKVFGVDSRLLSRRNSSLVSKAKMNDTTIIIEFKSICNSLTLIRTEISKEYFQSSLQSVTNGLSGNSQKKA